MHVCHYYISGHYFTISFKHETTLFNLHWSKLITWKWRHLIRETNSTNETASNITFNWWNWGLFLKNPFCFIQKIRKNLSKSKCHANKVWNKTLLKATLFDKCFSRFLKCGNGTKSRNAPHINIYFLY